MFAAGRPFTYWALRSRRAWHSSLLPSLVGPALYMVVMGEVLGTFVRPGAASASLGGVSYADYVVPGVVAAAAMLLATAEATFPVQSAIQSDRTYAAMLATPLTIADIVAGHLLWITARLFVVSSVLAVLATALGATHSPQAVLLVPIGTLTGLAFAGPVMAYAATQETDAGLLNWQRFGATPLLLFSGVFYPLAQLPEVLQAVVQLSPLAHGAELCRAAASGDAFRLASFGHVAVLVAYAVVGVVLANRTFRRRLVEQ